MRYNPPPNWPKPPKGWVPHADWAPDPSWPPPPQGWRLWVEEDGADPPPNKSALGRLGQTGDDVEYFGDDVAWSEDSGPAPAQEERNAADPAPAPQPTEIAPEDIAVQHLGRYATVKWGDDQYDIGKIVAVSADPAAVNLKLAGIEAPVSFPRGAAPGEPGSPRLYVWI